jgi:hypothetical protein
MSSRLHRRITFCLAGLVLVLGVGVVAFVYQGIRQEKTRIRVRYQQMMIALSAGDTNAVRSLIAPEWRSRFHLSRFEGFAKPLGPRSSILILGREATVWPVRTSHYVVLPGGHTVEMIKVADQWFFTGEVHVD